VAALHVEYAERKLKHGIIFIFSPFYEYANLDYVRVHVIYRVNQAEYGVPIPVAAFQEYVNLYSTRRVAALTLPASRQTGPSNLPRRFHRVSPGGDFCAGLPRPLGQQ